MQNPDNQNNQDSNKEQNTDNGLELLKKVIETNEANIEHTIEFSNFREDLLNLVGEAQSTVSSSLSFLEDAQAFTKNEKKEREEFLDSFPKSIDARISDEAQSQIREFEKKFKIANKFYWYKIAVLGMAIIVLSFSIIQTKIWHSESIRSKSELRQEILDEFSQEGKSLYPISDMEELRLNTELFNKWINSSKNSVEVQKFLQYRNGYLSGREK